MSSVAVPAPTALTAAQCRAGRALIEWSQAQLSQSAAIDIQTVADFERRFRAPDETTRRRLRASARSGGRGIRFRKWRRRGRAPEVQPRRSVGSEPLGRRRRRCGRGRHPLTAGQLPPRLGHAEYLRHFRLATDRHDVHALGHALQFRITRAASSMPRSRARPRFAACSMASSMSSGTTTPGRFALSHAPTLLGLERNDAGEHGHAIGFHGIDESSQLIDVIDRPGSAASARPRRSCGACSPPRRRTWTRQDSRWRRGTAPVCRAAHCRRNPGHCAVPRPRPAGPRP